MPLSLAVLDVDNFKSYNDSFGHLVGDHVLTSIARLLQHTARRDDFTARYGGEEFVVLMPNTTADGAREMAERIRLAAETASWKHRPVTVSIGLATFSGDDHLDSALSRAMPRDVPRKNQKGTLNGKISKTSKHEIPTQSSVIFAQADAALYVSKHQGRNRVTHHDDLAEKS